MADRHTLQYSSGNARKLRRINVAAQEPDAHRDELPPILACAQTRVRVSLRGPERGERRV